MPLIDSQPQFAGYVDTEPWGDFRREQNKNYTIESHEGIEVDDPLFDFIHATDLDAREVLGVPDEAVLRHSVRLSPGSTAPRSLMALAWNEINDTDWGKPGMWHADAVGLRYTVAAVNSTEVLAGRYFLASEVRGGVNSINLLKHVVNLVLLIPQTRRGLIVKSDPGQITRLTGSEIHRSPGRKPSLDENEILITDDVTVVDK